MLGRLFSFIVKWRWLWVVLYGLLLPPFGFFAAKITQDNSIERLIVPDDPDYARTREFQRTFGKGEYAVIAFEAKDPFAREVVDRADRTEKALGATKGVEVNSAIGVFRDIKAIKGSAPLSAEELDAFRGFATKTDLLKRQGLVGDDFLAMALVLEVEDTAQRREILRAIDEALSGVEKDPGPITAVRRLGQQYVSVYLDDTSQRTGNRLFGLFMVFVVVLCLGLYRSARTLVAFLLTLGVCLALSMGYIGLSGGKMSIVSPMVPMTILVTVLATLVYLQSRFIDKPADRSFDEHQIFSLSNKFVACTASIFATAVGFAALSVSKILPIREMGIWVAVGLAISWVVIFTLFPALQKIVKTPTSEQQKPAAPWFLLIVERLPRWSYKYRWPLVITSLVLSACGAVALFGLPGAVKPMELRTDPISYIAKDARVAVDYHAMVPKLPGMSITNVWITGKFHDEKGEWKPGLGSLSEPEVLTALHQFSSALEADPDVGAAIGPTTILRISRYGAGQGDGWPTDEEALNDMATMLDDMAKPAPATPGPDGEAPRRPVLQRFVKAGTSQAQIAIVSKVVEREGFERVAKKVQQAWDQAVENNPALRRCEPKDALKKGQACFEMSVAGLSPLQAKMSQSLVPTLVESFALTVAVIFATFLVVFRSGAARVMAMIPSLFAILVMFGVMRVTGMGLNVATILIASTVLGTSENDQIHFFYHFQEKRKDASVEESLKHTLRVAGKAILFATLINAGGFMAFAAADLPPMRQFGILTALAFALSMLADFTALPAAVWIVFRAKPDEEKKSAEGKGAGEPEPSTGEG